MFHHIEGKVSDLEPYLAVVDCGGVGYALNTTLYTLSELKLGERAKLYVYESIREDCFDLYGFSSKAEKRSFELLVGVSGGDSVRGRTCADSGARDRKEDRSACHP